MTLFITEGRVVFAFDTGDGLIFVRTNGTYSDGEWHSVSASRVTLAGIAVQTVLEVDSERVEEIDNLGSSGGFLDVSELVYVGGYDSRAITLPEILRLFGVVNHFDGCLDGVSIDGLHLTINSIYFVRARSVSACTTVTFHNPRAYVAYPSAHADSTTEGAISFRFSTTQPDALLLFLGPSQSTSDYFAAELVGGRLRVSYELGSGAAQLLSTGKAMPPPILVFR